jgi:CheY-like chemotaxis protein
MSFKPVEILLVENDSADAELTQCALKESGIATNVHVVKDGLEALAFLRREGKYADSPRPNLILLDLNMPRMDGRTFLAEVKADEDLMSIPVVVLTTSEADKDVAKGYHMGAKCFITKPVGLAEFTGVVKFIEKFWFPRVRFPKE